MDLKASVRRAVDLLGQAASQGAKLVVFGETWLPGYPAWLDYCPNAALWDHEPTKEIYAALRQNSLSLDGPETQEISIAARDNQVVLVIGVNEKVEKGPGNGTLFNSLLTFGADGALVNHHRKLVPTYTERLVWGQGNGEGLTAVQTSCGRIGGLICWEHWMPLARQALHNSGEHIHVAVWPTVNEIHQLASRHYAFEGRCFVLAAGLLLPFRDVHNLLPVKTDHTNNLDSFVLRGGSAIIGPNGQYIVEPLFDDARILTAELDLQAVHREQMTLDVSGHYHRPDLFEFHLKNPE